MLRNQLLVGTNKVCCLHLPTRVLHGFLTKQKLLVFQRNAKTFNKMMNAFDNKIINCFFLAKILFLSKCLKGTDIQKSWKNFKRFLPCILFQSYTTFWPQCTLNLMQQQHCNSYNLNTTPVAYIGILGLPMLMDPQPSQQHIRYPTQVQFNHHNVFIVHQYQT